MKARKKIRKFLKSLAHKWRAEEKRSLARQSRLEAQPIPEDSFPQRIYQRLFLGKVIES